MKFTLQYLAPVDSEGTPGLQGELTADGFHCLTLGRVDKLLAPGTYGLVPGHMASHNADRALVTGTEPHEGVFIHSGVKAADSLMCPLVGGSRPTPGTLTGGLPIADHVFQLVKDNPGSTLEVVGIQVGAQSEPVDTDYKGAFVDVPTVVT